MEQIFEDIDSIGVIPILVRDTEKAFDKPMFENVIEAEVASIHLPFRLALYERALLNFTKNNGPSTLLLYSTCKSIFYNKFDESFKPVSAEWFARNYGMVFGSQFPMTSTNTNFTWEDEDPHAILKAISVTNDQPKVENRLHPFSCRDNVIASFSTALTFLIRCLRSSVLEEDALLTKGLIHLNQLYQLDADIFEYFIAAEKVQKFPVGTIAQLEEHLRIC